MSFSLLVQRGKYEQSLSADWCVYQEMSVSLLVR